MKFTASNLLAAAAVCAVATAFRAPMSLRTSTSLRAEENSASVFGGKPTMMKEEVEQEVKDLNLEEMFEVFEEAAKVKITFDPKDTVGSSAPFGFFDPASFCLDISEDQYKIYQEAETKHGRVAMLAFLGIVIGEMVNPLFDGAITGPAIYQFQQADAILPLFWVGVTWFIAMIEGQTIISAWQPLQETMNEPLGLAKLSKTHVAGDLRFDPLNLKPRTDKDLRAMRTKEINNGRLAMIGVVGIVVQELITNTPIF
ncbi:chlorophyll a/b-binding protein domain-containing protein [Ochromonadaceae sp. CCMP2298]|nr:chlorophyll a/b-binding protein domain-containing protein [Ochromonadaceae sp. CCMP2298]